MSGRQVTSGSRARGAGGRFIGADGGTVLWNEDSGWTGVRREVWEYSVGGFSVLAKWLSYRIGAELTGQDLDEFTAVARRIAALVQSGPELDRLFLVARERRLEAPSEVAPAAVIASA